MRIIHGEAFPHVYTRLITELMERPDQVRSPRGLKCAEITPCILQFPVGWREDGLIESPARSTDRRYLAGELLFYYHGLRDVKHIARYSKFWEKIANPDGTVNSAYGWQLFRKQNDYGITEWQWAINQLARDPDTRQAVMLLHAPRHHYTGNKDVPCTMNIAFSRRGENLDMIVTMRSNDVWFGVTYDIPFFITVLRNACMLLDLSPGTYTHIAYNMHAYEKDWPALRTMIADGITGPEDPLPRHRRPWLGLGGEPTVHFTLRKDPLAAYLAQIAEWTEVTTP